VCFCRRDDAHQERLAELRALKSEYSAGQWNVNSVLLGGLGKDPQLENSGQCGMNGLL